MKKLIIGLGVLVVIGVIVVAAISRKTTPGEEVYAAEVSRGDVVTVVTGTGVIQPRTKVNISSEIYGQIVELPVKEGQVVRKGDLLVRIDPEKYRSEVDRLSANLRVNRIAIESEDVGLRNFELDQKRARDLQTQGVLSSSERERAELAVDTSRIRLKSLKESVVQAEAALKRAQDELGKTRIYAPMDGKITQVNTEVGEQVIVGTTNIPGSVILVISDMGEVLAEVNVDETEVVKLSPGQSAKVTADAVEKTTYEGRVTEIRNTAKKEGDINVFGVKVLLTSPDERLRPGMTAKAKIEVERRQNVLRIPLQAVTTRERKKLEEQRKAAAMSAGASKDPSGKAQGAGAPSTDKGPDGGSAADGSKSPVVRTASRQEESDGRADRDETKSGSERKTADGDRVGSGDRAVDGDTARVSGQATAPDAGKVPAGGGRPARGSARGADDREEIEVVYVMDHDRARSVPVKTGSSDEQYVEIQQGLEEGATIVKGPYRILKRLKDGDRLVKKKEEGEEGEESDGAGGSESSS